MASVSLLVAAWLAWTPLAVPQQGAGAPAAVDERVLLESCRATFAALQAGDIARLEASFPDAGELAALLESMVAQMPEARRAEARRQLTERGLDRMRADALTTTRRRFETARREASIDWPSARFVAPLPQSEPPQPFATVGWVVRDVEFLVLAGDRLVSFGGKDVARGPRGWVFLEGPSYRGTWRRDDGTAPRDGEAEALLAQTRAELELAALQLEASRAELERTEQLRLEERRELSLAADAWRAESEARAVQHDEALREMYAELDRVRGAARDREAELEEHALRASYERDDLAVQLAAMREEAQHLAQENEAARARQALLEQELAALRTPRPGPIPGRALPAWCGAVADVALRDALLSPFPVDVASLDALEALRVIADHRGVHTLVLPEARVRLQSATVEDLGPDRTVAEALLALAGGDLALDGDLVVLGAADERTRLLARRVSPTLRAALRSPDAPKISGDLVDLTAADVLQFLSAVSGVSHFVPYELEGELRDTWLGLTCTRELALGEALDLVLGLCDAHAALLEGVLVVTRTPLAALPKLDAEVTKRLPKAPVDVDLASPGYLDERLTNLAALLGVEVAASQEAFDADLVFGTLALSRVEPATVLALHELDLGGSYVWRVVAGAVRLSPR